MLTNADITIYHKQYNPLTRLDEWQITQYHNVTWYGEQAVSTAGQGLSTVDAYIVRIVTQDAIIVSLGDIVVRGLVDKTILGIAQLAEYERFVVTTVRDNRRGSRMLQHWRIEGG